MINVNIFALSRFLKSSTIRHGQAGNFKNNICAVVALESSLEHDKERHKGLSRLYEARRGIIK